jgi:hypothetical protein
VAAIHIIAAPGHCIPGPVTPRTAGAARWGVQGHGCENAHSADAGCHFRDQRVDLVLDQRTLSRIWFSQAPEAFVYSFKNWVYVASVASAMAFAAFILLRTEGLGLQLGAF